MRYLDLSHEHQNPDFKSSKSSLVIVEKFTPPFTPNCIAFESDCAKVEVKVIKNNTGNKTKFFICIAILGFIIII